MVRIRSSREGQWPHAQRLLFVGCASTWGLLFVLASGMVLEPRLNPVDMDMLREMWKNWSFFCLGWAPAIMTLAAIASLVSSICIRMSPRHSTKETACRILPYCHAIGMGTFAYELISTLLWSLNISSTRLPPPYHIILLDDLVYTGRLMLPALAMLALSVLLLWGSPLVHYVRSSAILLYTIALVVGIAVLNAILMLHLTPVMASFG